ncbi:MAG TPA: tetratricopeptide repeat protein [Candidatus Acidoferrum sp.]|nr:tetratricopeptide repeat protein [Candidatus Acidoferrum sp.]
MKKPEKWEKIKEIVGAALERDPSQRTAFLDEVCSGDEKLREEVESLLSAHAEAGYLSESAFTTEIVDTPAVSRALGPYRLLKKLGEGGMGQVWLAEQTIPVRRKVALKLIKSGMYDDSALRRFQSERQSLAIMDHPAIAKVFDAGATPDGQPYFAMEFVPGVAITNYCDEKKLKIRDRLELFIRACEGVQHAHQKAIIHRDLKPANILVLEVDGKAMPRIIDFGLAKTLTPYFSGESMNTLAGSFVGTPGYMSPEQADPGIQDVDTRTDVYSLGVVLYELLTGFLPFDAAEWKKLPLVELLRHLREEDPPRPSTKVSTARDASASNARARGTEPPQLVSALRGDLDWITLKALDKDRNRRYGMPSEIVADIRRYLKNEPILARPASAGYRLRKYVRRHRVGVTVAAGLFMLLTGFAVLQAVQLRRITRERDRADRVAQFMTNMFTVSNPSESRGNTITAREILDRASKDINTGLSKDPELQANMLDLMGRVYSHLGLYAKAQELLSPAVEIRRRVLGPRNPDTLWSMVNLANALSDQARFPEADKLYQEVIDTGRSVGAPAHRRVIAAMNNIALNLLEEGRVADAEKMQRDVVETQRRSLGPEAPDTLTSISNLALTVRSQGHFADAVTLDRQVLEARQRALGPDHPDTLRSAANLTLDLIDEQGHDNEAEQLIRPTLEAQRRIVGPEHPDTLVSMDALSNALSQQKKFAEAEAVTRKELEILQRTRGPEHPRTLRAMSNLATVLDQEGNHAEAARQFRELWQIQRRVRGPEHSDTLLSQTNLSAALLGGKQLDEAEKLARDALAIERRALGDENSLTVDQMFILSNILRQLGRATEAETLLRETKEHQSHIYGIDNPKTALSTYTLGTWAALRGDREKAFGLLREAIEHGLDASTVQGMENDADLKSLRGDPRFASIVADARQHVAGQRTK